MDGLAAVAVGTVLTTWPEAFARWWPSWPPFRIAMLLVFVYASVRAFWIWLRRHQARSAAQQAAG